MGDFKAEWFKGRVQKQFEKERTMLRRIKKMLLDNDRVLANEFKTELRELKGTVRGGLLEAQIRDMIDLQANADFSTQLVLEDFGLRPIGPKGLLDRENCESNLL